MKNIIENIENKFWENFVLFQTHGFNQVFSSKNYIVNIFPKHYNLKKYKNNYEKYLNVHKNIPKILEWNIKDNYFIQEKIQNIQDDWGNNKNIEIFFWKYLENIFNYSHNNLNKNYLNKNTHNNFTKNNNLNNILEKNNISDKFIKKIYTIYLKDNNIENKKYLAELIKNIKNNSEIFQDDYENIIHWDLSDTNILYNGENFYLIDFENISDFDIYYDLVSFDYFVQKNNSDIYKNIFWNNNKIFSETRYNINKDFFTFIHKNNLWNLI